MILPKLIKRHLKYKDDKVFYELQATDAIRWMATKGVSFGPEIHALDLGCGHGVFGNELSKMKCRVTFSDERKMVWPELDHLPFIPFNLDVTPLKELGQFDLVICSNVFEHISKPDKFITELADTLKSGAFFFLSWTNWLSPWGGHEFSPFHYLGPNLGPRLHDAIRKTPRPHIPYTNLFPTYIGKTACQIRSNKALKIVAMAPRYYTEFDFLMSIPALREILSWNCAILIQRV